MRKLRRKISLEDLRTRDEGLLFGSIVADFIYMKVPLIQTLDDMGIFTDLPFTPSGDECVQFNATLQVTNITCFEGQNPPAEGSITVTPFGGTAPYMYSWSNGQSNQTAVNLVPNTYTVTVMDANGCTLDLEATVTATEDAEPNVTVTSTQDIDIYPAGTVIPIDNILPDDIILCDGETVTFAAESGFVTYQWEDGADNIIGNTESIVIDTDGSYFVTVVNADGCVGESLPVNVIFIEQVPPVISVTNLPPYATGSGTQGDPYVICDPTTTTQPFLEFEVANQAAYDFFKWESDPENGNPTGTLISEWCTVQNPCPQNIEVSSICDAGVNSSNLLTSNTIWVAYDNGFSECSLLSEGGGS